jgi:two-component system, NtrC family, sensor kinase
MRIVVLNLLFIFLPAFFMKAQSQKAVLDSLHHVLVTAPDDTVRMVTLDNLAGYYAESNRDSSMYFTEASIVIAKKMNQQLYLADLLLTKSYLVQKQANFTLSLKLCNEALAILEDKRNEKGAYIPADDEFANDLSKYRKGMKISVYHQLGNTYAGVGDKDKAIEYFKKEIRIADELNSTGGKVTSNMNIGSIYAELKKMDSAFIYAMRALENVRISRWKDYEGFILADIGQIYLTRGLIDSAKFYFRNAIQVNREQNNLAGESGSNNSMADLFEKQGKPDSMLFYANAALEVAYRLQSARAISLSTGQVAKAWNIKGNADSAITYFMISKKLSDSLQENYNKKVSEFQKISFDEQMRLEKETQESIAAKNKIRTIGLFTGLGLLSMLAIIFYRNNIQKQKANKVLETTLTNLKSTQSQLIQSEKMASLGELTAGIAHEIQNPLNFVNNFSEVSRELIDELKSQRSKLTVEEQDELLSDIDSNLEKINHHGKRADAIVKGMLQHSRSSSSAKEPTNINALADEYLRLAYHGLRAKDKFFNATLKTDYDESIGNLNIIPQDIGRVILNLITNAFYAVNEKAKSDYDNYEPIVTVKTFKITGEGSNKIQISVADNGDGIPKKVLDKIFQPFFTTKPTGQGTGLGLSLSYDIVKAHGGELKVETKEGEGSEFIIQLPI